MERTSLGRYIVVENRRQLLNILEVLQEEQEGIRWSNTPIGSNLMESIPYSIPFPYILVIGLHKTLKITSGPVNRYTTSGFKELKYEELFPVVKSYGKIRMAGLRILLSLIIIGSIHILGVIEFETAVKIFGGLFAIEYMCVVYSIIKSK